MSLESTIESGFITSIRTKVNANLFNHHFGVSELADMMGMSRSTLHRKVHDATGESVSRLICRIKLEHALGLLEDGSLSVSDIAFQSGFHSVTYFTKCFKEVYGYSPREAGKIKNHQSNNGSQIKQRKITVPLYQVVILIAVVSIAIGTRLDLFHIIGKAKEKSVAVLPFEMDGPDPSESYIMNGTMEAILYRLNTISDLRVVTRESVEYYRDQNLTFKEIAKALNVNYILTGSIQRYNNKLRLIIRLIDTKHNRSIWTEQYNEDIEEIEQLFALYSEVAQDVAAKFEATITPVEKERIESMPTSNEFAYEFYQKGREAYWEYFSNPSDQAALRRAEGLYRISMEYDPAYIQPCINLGWIFLQRQEHEVEISASLLDSVQKYLKISFKYNTEPIQEYNLLGYYYLARGQNQKSLESFRMILRYDPYSYYGYSGLASVNWSENDFAGAIENFQKALIYAPPDEKARINNNLSLVYLLAGCKEQSDQHSLEMLKLNDDSATYFALRGMAEYLIDNNIPSALQLLLNGHAINVGQLLILKNLGEIYLDLGDIEKSLQYFQMYDLQMKRQNKVDLYGYHMIGFAWLQAGDPEKAEYYLERQVLYSNKMIQINPTNHSQLAMIEAWRGNNDAAMDHLRALARLEHETIYVLRNYKDGLFFKNLQDLPEFDKIREELISKYRAEHERVMVWLRRNGMA